MTTGMDRHTGKSLGGWDHVVQSLYYLFALLIGARVMRRSVGSAVPIILGRENLTQPALGQFWAAIMLAIELWEPRFKIRQVIYPIPENSGVRVRAGQLGVRLIGQYRPNALLGDFTVAAIGGEKDFVL